MLTTLSVALARKQELTACQKMAGKAGCHRTKIGYVTKDMGKNLLACIHTPDGSGICWPGGKTGYNMSIQNTGMRVGIKSGAAFSITLLSDFIAVVDITKPKLRHQP